MGYTKIIRKEVVMKILEIRLYDIFKPSDLNYCFVNREYCTDVLTNYFNNDFEPLIIGQDIIKDLDKFSDEEIFDRYKERAFDSDSFVSTIVQELPDNEAEAELEIARRNFNKHFHYLKEVTAYDFPAYYNACREALDKWENLKVGRKLL